MYYDNNVLHNKRNVKEKSLFGKGKGLDAYECYYERKGYEYFATLLMFQINTISFL